MLIIPYGIVKFILDKYYFVFCYVFDYIMETLNIKLEDLPDVESIFHLDNYED